MQYLCLIRYANNLYTSRPTYKLTSPLVIWSSRLRQFCGGRKLLIIYLHTRAPHKRTIGTKDNGLQTMINYTGRVKDCVFYYNERMFLIFKSLI